MNKTAVFSLLAILSLTACDQLGIGGNKNETATCGSPETAKLITELFKAEAEKGTLAFMDEVIAENDTLKNISITDARTALSQINVSLADVRTTEQSDKSSKLRCEAALRLEIPETMLQKAIEGNQFINGSNRNSADFLERDYKREGGYFVRNVSYFVQPTDDGKKLFAGLDAMNETISPINELVALFLITDPVKNEQKQQEAQAASEEAARTAELEALNQEQLAARLQEIKTRHTGLLKDINSVWDKLPKAVQDKLLPNQTAWNKSHQSECQYRAKSEYTEEAEQQIADLECRSWRIEARIEELKQAQNNMAAELLKDAEQKYQRAAEHFTAAAHKVPNDIMQILGTDLKSWIEQTKEECRRKIGQSSDKVQGQLEAYECAAKSLGEKAKELEGYSIN